MSNHNTKVELKNKEGRCLKTNEKSLIAQLALSLREAGIDAQMVRKIKYS